MKKFAILALVLVVAATCVFGFAACGSDADYVVGIVQLAPHPALDQTNSAFKAKLTELLEAEGLTVDFIEGNAQGEDSNNASIVDGFIGRGADLVYAIATGSAQTATSRVRDYDIPVIFNAVTDPVDAGLVTSMTAPTGANVTGVSDVNPVELQFELICDLMGGSTDFTVGVLYTTKESNSVVQKERLREVAQAKGVDFVEAGIADTSNIGDGLNALGNAGADIVYIPTDNMLAENAGAVHSQNLSLGHKFPIVCGEKSMTESCGIATISVSYSYLGELAAESAFEILVNGKNAGDISVKIQEENYDKILCQDIADDIGFTIPDSVIAEFGGAQ